jgi:pseudouridine-5'-phosphate glycosidase
MSARRDHPNSNLFEIAEEVAQAFSEGRPIVGLESAALARGFPGEMGIDVEEQIENAVRENGAVPALLFLRNGRIHVGGTPADVAAIAGDRRAGRASRSTLIGVLDAPGYGVTTVSASMMICRAVGIKVLSVGGIGGVHRGAFWPEAGATAVSLDVSPDLEELARTSVVVVASGAKSFLDLPATMQWLETRGVPVVTLGGRTVPGYFSVESSEESPIVVNTVDEGARLVNRHFALGPDTGLLFCVPVPAEAAIPLAEVEQATRIGSAEVAAKGIVGAPVTAAVLEVIARETNNRTFQAQIAMSIRNAAVAAQLAKQLGDR